MKLFYETNGQEVKVGDITKDFRGDTVKVVGFREPQSTSSTGRVHVNRVNAVTGKFYDYTDEYFPAVIGAKWK